jgi:hypothetical protein
MALYEPFFFFRKINKLLIYKNHMNKEELLRELRKQFDLTKDRLGFDSLFDEINSISYIEDMVLSQGFVSNQFSRQMINRIVETFYSWVGEIYNWIFPQPMDIIHNYENKKLSEEEKKEFLLIVDRIMYLVRKNKRIAFEGLKPEQEGNFIDELVKFDRDFFNPFMLKFHNKFEKGWEEEILKGNKKI